MTHNPVEAVAAIVRDEWNATKTLSPGAEMIAQGPPMFFAGLEAKRLVEAGEMVLGDAPDDVRAQASEMLAGDRIGITVVRS